MDLFPEEGCDPAGDYPMFPYYNYIDMVHNMRDNYLGAILECDGGICESIITKWIPSLPEEISLQISTYFKIGNVITDVIAINYLPKESDLSFEAFCSGTFGLGDHLMEECQRKNRNDVVYLSKYFNELTDYLTLEKINFRILNNHGLHNFFGRNVCHVINYDDNVPLYKSILSNEPKFNPNGILIGDKINLSLVVHDKKLKLKRLFKNTHTVEKSEDECSFHHLLYNRKGKQYRCFFITIDPSSEIKRLKLFKENGWLIIKEELIGAQLQIRSFPFCFRGHDVEVINDRFYNVFPEDLISELIYK